MLMDVRQSRTRNGIRVITSAVPHVQSATIGIWVAVGSRHEPAPLAGASHFIEHMLFKGTKRRSAAQISRAIEGRGGYLNAFTQEENTCYHAHVADDQLPRAADVLCDMYLNPLMSSGDFAKEKGVILEEIMMCRDQPSHVVQELLNEVMWKGHPLGQPVPGTPDVLKRMRRSDVLAFKQRHYCVENTVFAFAGNVEHARCVAMVEELAGRLARRGPARCRAVTRRVAQERVAWQAKEIEQAHLAMGFRLFGCHDERRYTLRLLNVVLGENMSSRLFQTVRERYGLAYSIHSSVQLFHDTGVLGINAGLDRARRGKALQLILRELARIKAEPIGRREFREAKDYIIGQLRLGLESMTHQMLWLGDNLMAQGRFTPPEEVIERIQAVTADDVRRLACAVVRPRAASLSLIAPGVDGKEVDSARRGLSNI